LMWVSMWAEMQVSQLAEDFLQGTTASSKN